jgi:hypothetical protein
LQANPVLPIYSALVVNRRPPTGQRIGPKVTPRGDRGRSRKIAPPPVLLNSRECSAVRVNDGVNVPPKNQSSPLEANFTPRDKLVMLKTGLSVLVTILLFCPMNLTMIIFLTSDSSKTIRTLDVPCRIQRDPSISFVRAGFEYGSICFKSVKFNCFNIWCLMDRCYDF